MCLTVVTTARYLDLLRDGSLMLLPEGAMLARGPQNICDRGHLTPDADPWKRGV